MKRILLIFTLLIAVVIPVFSGAAELNNITAKGVDGDLVYYDKSGNAISTWDAANRKFEIPSGSTIDVESGGYFKIAGTTVTPSAAELNILTGVTATAGEINMAADNSANVETVITTNVITAAESGKTFFLDLAGGFESTLPAPAAGLRFSFIVKTAPTTGSYTIVTNGTTQKVLKGLVLVAADGVGDVSAGGTTATFAANQALPGDRIDMICDGTIWYMKGFAQVAAGITITGE